MLTNAKLQSIIWTSKPSSAERFYVDILELELKGRSDGALVFSVGGGDLRVCPIPDTRPTEHTVLGFSVAELDTTIGFLNSKGVKFEKFDGFPHEENAALNTPDGSRVAWFRDPDGNLLSIVQYNYQPGSKLKRM